MLRKFDPVVAREKARYAAQKRHHPDDDHSAQHAELVAATWLSRTERLLDLAPPLSDAQRARLAARIVPVLVGGEYDAA